MFTYEEIFIHVCLPEGVYIFRIFMIYILLLFLIFRLFFPIDHVNRPFF